MTHLASPQAGPTSPGRLVTAHHSSLPPSGGSDPEPMVLPGGFAACGLDGRPENAGQARRFVGRTLDQWALSTVAADTKVVVSELVTNAVRHAVEPMRPHVGEYPLWLGLFRYSAQLMCAVSDPSPDAPRQRLADACAVGGRGLHLINSLSDSWSWELTAPRGKTVWAALRLPAP
ncbi:ATP-binding protein [Streptomyces sp. NPDC055287]